MKKRFNKRYISGDLPWNINRPDENLIKTVEEFNIQPCKSLDIGCGTGDNVFWAANNGFDATGIDISPKAIEMAKEKSQGNNINANFFVKDLFKEEIPGAPFGFVFDRGCFHTFNKKKQRRNYARIVSSLLSKEGMWLTLAGNYDDGRLDIGPPKRKALDLVAAIEPWFEILMLKQSRFDSNDKIPSKIWVALMKKREV
ncbi:MAG: class I SAM-dependent methyltransferase [Bacteroidales bacterium]|nr:class I SAM-dependent methyltransferase [Bacteroidales bacterium]MCF8405909.1 class I SAM-dependent methyltransferase [Bacteroidales bacterium]